MDEILVSCTTLQERTTLSQRKEKVVQFSSCNSEINTSNVHISATFQENDPLFKIIELQGRYLLDIIPLI